MSTTGRRYGKRGLEASSGSDPPPRERRRRDQIPVRPEPRSKGLQVTRFEAILRPAFPALNTATGRARTMTCAPRNNIHVHADAFRVQAAQQLRKTYRHQCAAGSSGRHSVATDGGTGREQWRSADAGRCEPRRIRHAGPVSFEQTLDGGPTGVTAWAPIKPVGFPAGGQIKVTERARGWRERASAAARTPRSATTETTSPTRKSVGVLPSVIEQVAAS